MPDPIYDTGIPLDTIISCLFTLGLLICSALISGSEVAFFSLTKSELDQLESLDTGNAKKLTKLISKPKRLLANVLVANNAINILIVLLFASLGEVFFSDLTFKLNLFFFKVNIRFLIEVVLITFIILIFGEVLPKIYATRNAKEFALLMSPVLLFLDKVFILITGPLTGLSNLIEKRLRSSKSNFSVDDLSQALELTSEEETTAEQKNILEGIVNFGNTETVQIMNPRMDICAISKKATFAEVLEIIADKGFSRNPVYDNNIDEIIGVLYTKDLLPHLHKKTFNWIPLIREPFFVPENKKLDDLLIDFQERKNHLAIVVDEYGGTSGLVTLEDVIEEIVGDISDEFDEVDLSYSKIDENNYVFDGKINLKDFCKVLELDEVSFEKDKGESETLAGLLLELSGRFPRKFEKIAYQNLTFTVEAIDRKRIKQIKVAIA
ncbi:gliding motility-associated protein GldE [Wenyingzhuangia marina]|uniref:Protein involved in gliding motility GldE n=1 Tax=Wenyingzhuangia marina TaxID=1195760 RepID=A0A1M5SWD3_9FLAO|nr:gliding motility-associated protein GldE [Wenyingzhuangia marina]GGF64462.1 hemolysin [Wenyingzhuangia marina]SHH42881.1 protein involved in gliding motility GldE [Wenyingzhuangia marina]